MKRFKVIVATMLVALKLVVLANSFAADKGRNESMGYCLDAAFHEETNRLYVAAGALGTHVFEVTKGKFNYTTTVYEGGYHRTLDILGDRVYLADARRGLVVFDITERIPVCTWKQQEPDTSGMGIDLHENRAYLAAGAEGLNIFDVSEPDSPKQIGTCKTNADAWDVWISGNYAYVADLHKGITVVDVSQPSQPHKISLVTWDKTEPMAEIVRGEGQTAYVAAGKHGLVVLDVHNPLDPQVISKYKLGPGGSGEGLCTRDGLVYLSSGNKNNRDENGLIIIDARVPGTLQAKSQCTFSGWVEGVCLAGDYAFIANAYSGIRSIDVSNPNNPRCVDSLGPTGEDSERDKTEVSRKENEITEYFERAKNEILQGREFNDLSTPANALLTLISAYHHEDRNTFEQIFPIIKQKQFKELLSPEVRSQMLAAATDSILCRIEIGDEPPEESDLCAIYTRESPEKPIDQVWSFAYVEGAWRFAGSTSAADNWRTQAKQAEAMTRNILRSEAEKAKKSTTDSLQQEAGGQDSSEKEQGATRPNESAGNCVLRLDGDGDYIQIADSQSLRSFSNAITIEAWFRASSFYPENGMINSILRKNITEGSENFFLRFRNVDGNPSVEMSIGYDVPGLKAPYDFAEDTWYHLAGTYDGSVITLSVNGISIKSEKVSGSLYIDESDLFIGKGDPEFSSGEFFHGALDELRIWNVARSPEEIQAAMNSPLTSKEDGLVVYLNFDDGTAKDLSGNSNDGILNKDARIVESSFPVSLAPDQSKAGKLVAWWKFENDANDAAGDNHGIINGNPTYADGKFGRAIRFDGDDYVDCGNPDSLNFSTGDWTISAWIKTRQSGIEDTDKGTIFANGADGGGGIRYTLAVNEGQSNSVTLTTDDDAHKAQAMGKTAVNDGVWHHVVGMRKAGQLHLYIDGALDGGNYLPADYDLSGSSEQKAYIGAITSNDDNSLYKYFVGLIDEVCIIRGSIDANGVRALYSGEDSTTVAQTAIISPVVAKPQSRRQPIAGAGPRGSIVGNWQMISDQISSKAFIEIRRESDDSLSATVVPENAADTSQAMSMNNVTFEDGKLRFEVPSDEGSFEGTMKEDGLTIAGEFWQQDQVMSIELKRVDPIPGETAPDSQELLQAQTSSTSSMATVLILALALAAVVGAIVFFLVKSSIR